MEIHSENAFGKWSVPECPFAIEYATRVLDDIRLAVIDAFFSLPRGGAEIGGLLLGRQENGRIVIVDSMPIPCEHAFGPSFVLSPRDHAALGDLLAAAKNNPNAATVGWWHSHTRSEIFLSEADQEIYNRFFPEQAQLALVLKPHTFQPTRAGFFFREKDGSIRGSASYSEFVVEALPMRVVPSTPVAAAPTSPGGRPLESNGPVIDVAQVAAAPPTPQVAAAPPSPPVEPVLRREAAPPVEPVARREAAPPDRPETPPPGFLDQPGRSRSWLPFVAVAIGLTAGVGVFATRASWLQFFGPSPPAALSLNVVDQDGQLQIRWNGASPVVRAAKGGTLLISDGPTPLRIALDPAHLQTGSFTYLRAGDRVDIALTVPQSGGREAREATAFTGSGPPKGPAAAPAADSALREERDALVSENERLKRDYARQLERTRVLEKGFEELRKLVQHEQQRKRLEVQSPDTAK